MSIEQKAFMVCFFNRKGLHL